VRAINAIAHGHVISTDATGALSRRWLRVPSRLGPRRATTRVLEVLAWRLAELERRGLLEEGPWRLTALGEHVRIGARDRVAVASIDEHRGGAHCRAMTGSGAGIASRA